MADTEPATTTEEQPVVEVMAGSGSGYRKRQVGLIGIVMIIAGLANIGNMVANQLYANIGNGVAYILMGLAFLWIEVEDKGEYLLVTSGPCRWLYCGWGKEKVKYDEIRDYEITKTCFYALPGECCLGVRLFNNCSCLQCGFCACGGVKPEMPGGCCTQTTVRLTINERMFGHDAKDDTDCCLESCCLENCFGAKCLEPCCCCGPRGEGCWFSMCNPCKANCCVFNTMFLSTNDPEGLIQLLNNKTGKNVETKTATI